MKSSSQHPNTGFTLIELLVVMGVIAILTSVVMVAVNPGRQFANARDTLRRADLYSITSAIVQYATQNNGNLPDQENFPATAACIGDTDPCFDLALKLVPDYLTSMPRDPNSGTLANTQYFIYQDENKRIIATASGELSNLITISR